MIAPPPASRQRRVRGEGRASKPVAGLGLRGSNARRRAQFRRDVDSSERSVVDDISSDAPAFASKDRRERDCVQALRRPTPPPNTIKLEEGSEEVDETTPPPPPPPSSEAPLPLKVSKPAPPPPLRFEEKIFVVRETFGTEQDVRIREISVPYEFLKNYGPAVGDTLHLELNDGRKMAVVCGDGEKGMIDMEQAIARRMKGLGMKPVISNKARAEVMQATSALRRRNRGSNTRRLRNPAEWIAARRNRAKGRFGSLKEEKPGKAAGGAKSAHASQDYAAITSEKSASPSQQSESSTKSTKKSDIQPRTSFSGKSEVSKCLSPSAGSYTESGLLRTDKCNESNKSSSARAEPKPNYDDFDKLVARPPPETVRRLRKEGGSRPRLNSGGFNNVWTKRESRSGSGSSWASGSQMIQDS